AVCVVREHGHAHAPPIVGFVSSAAEPWFRASPATRRCARFAHSRLAARGFSPARHIKIVLREAAQWNFLLARVTASARSHQTDYRQRATMFNTISTMIALSGSRPTQLSGVNMSYVISLH